MKRFFLSALVAISTVSLSAQSYYISNPHRDNKFPVIIHSNNDYKQSVPFFQAYSQGVSSIEVDLHLYGDKLVVSGDGEALESAPSFDSLYINRIAEVFRGNGARPWRDSELTLTLYLELVSGGKQACDILLERLQQWPEIFDATLNPYAVRCVVSAKDIAKENFVDYPSSYIMFDGDVTESYSAEELERVALFSCSIKDYSFWGGKGVYTASEGEAIKGAIDHAHSLGKPIRFHSTGDCPNAWVVMYDAGADMVVTDNPEACAIFFNDYHKKCFVREEGNAPYKPYVPTYKSDGAERAPKNVILVIGDGMSLTQITAADGFNGGMTLTNMRYIGMQKTNAKDSYVTDSAAAGSALATGVKHNNRHISASPEGEPIPSLSEKLGRAGYKIGVLTAAEVADATAAVFFGHNTERGEYEDLVSDFLYSEVDILAGSDARPFNKRSDGVNIFDKLSERGFKVCDKVEEVAQGDATKVVCIDERLGEYVKSREDMSLLSDMLTGAVEVLKRDNDKGYFIMVEAAKIDHTGHGNDIRGQVTETINMDLALEQALRIADEDGETLVLVTGDHETGGLTLVGGERGQKIVGIYTSNDHTAVMLPVFAYGPSAQKFIGVYENTAIPQIIESLLVK